MLVHITREYNLNKIFLSNLGLWPSQGQLTRNLLPILYLALQISYYPFEILMLHDHRDDAHMVFESLYQLVISSAFIARLWNAFFSCSKVNPQDKFRRLYEVMNDHWDIFTKESEVQILRDYSVISRNFTVLYSIIIYGVSLVFIVTPLTPIFLDIVSPLNESRPRIFAIDVEFRLDLNEYFVPIFCYISAIFAVGATILIGTDTMHFACTIHACSLFAIIGQRIENAIAELNMSKYKRCLNTELESLREQMIHREYIVCLKKYQLALEFVNILDATHQTVAIFSIFLIGATLSLIGVRIVFVLNEPKEMARFICLIVATLIQLMVMCYSGQKLIDESQNVFYRAYAAEWYTYSPRLKSLLLMTLYRSIEPCSLTAGKLLPLSMTTYAGVVRTGMTYFTAFLSMKD